MEISILPFIAFSLGPIIMILLDPKTGYRKSQQNYRLGTVSNELLGGLN